LAAGSRCGTSAINEGLRIVANPGVMFRMTALLTLTAGTTSLMFVSDQISRRRIGNGMFLVFVPGTVAALSGIFVPLPTGQIDPVAVLTYTVLQAALVAVISRGYRRAFAPPRPA
jgi:preprotein translocase subunit SecY